ncbi:protein of unknown function [Methylorubrum extorquens]|uniref:Uncharacterized protein n=1 Tax=Methylorubrum extorquens TaxID=408 RepID=A0A2N9AWQ8_METEX|nr:protein of unknown function [Methylorubrum extorquens]
MVIPSTDNVIAVDRKTSDIRLEIFKTFEQVKAPQQTTFLGELPEVLFIFWEWNSRKVTFQKFRIPNPI